MKAKGKVIKSIFMLIIATLFSSLCITFAWFISIREQSVASNGISMTGMDGTLYYFSGNHVGGEWCGYPETEKPSTAPNATFEAYDKTAQAPNNPFLMENIKPSARFLFYIKAKVKDESKDVFDVYFSVSDWICEFEGTPYQDSVDMNHPWCEISGVKDNVNLTRAIEVYTIDKAIPVGVDKAGNDAKILAWADDFLSQSGTQTANMFSQTTKTNKTGNDVMLNHSDQSGNVTPYKFNKNTEYLIPFIIEFSDENTTWFSSTPDASIQSGGENKFTQDSNNGNSNVYMGQKFTFTEICLSHFDPRMQTNK